MDVLEHLINTVQSVQPVLRVLETEVCTWSVTLLTLDIVWWIVMLFHTYLVFCESLEFELKYAIDIIQSIFIILSSSLNPGDLRQAKHLA
jgi:hypothetical protein